MSEKTTGTDGAGQARPDTGLGAVKANVLEHFVPGLRRTGFVGAVRDPAWPG
ncbi:hypothetical protein [Streptomyces sp. NEAU-W12]|uniref:hypothetical protein n=1 Tax=Streptomyces sp. NEAU-W12 TaxID=2994668 RepID=UPI00224B83E7|nr:hypothetical protein [Streptomyces sp. NEAU-W12]MCX2924057.1 hypothetical protein [Streptomyces sp. NEAU-W12]